MKVVFIAGRFRADTLTARAANVHYAQEWALRVWQAGACAVCPHMNSGLFFGLQDEKTFELGYRALLKRCDAVLAIPGWQDSKGACCEVNAAQFLRIPVFRPTGVQMEDAEWLAFTSFLKRRSDYGPGGFELAERIVEEVRAVVRAICETCRQGRSNSCADSTMERLRIIIGEE